MTKEKIKEQLWKIHLISVKLMDNIRDDEELAEVWDKLNDIRIDSTEAYSIMCDKINNI